jgi:hypothetical protein
MTAHNIPYTYSDLTDRIARLALRRVWKSNRPFGVAALKAAIAEIEPPPIIWISAGAPGHERYHQAARENLSQRH